VYKRQANHWTGTAFHPESIKQNNLTPEYRFWNGTSTTYQLGDIAELDPNTGGYPTARPIGDIGDSKSKLYPFKYKTAEQPMIAVTKQLVALDTSVFFASGDGVAATKAGLVNMGLSADTPYEWVKTDTYQALNHQVAPKYSALSCNECHGSGRIDFKKLGYTLKAPQNTLCSTCHSSKSYPGFFDMHDKHVRDKKLACSNCHDKR